MAAGDAGAPGGARVALVLVSHSAAVADGTARIAGQMAPDVLVLAAGGTQDGDQEVIGTDFGRVLDAVGSAAGRADGVVVLTDLGSAVLTTESVLEAVDEDVASRVRLADAPFVEGAVTAAVEAQQGGDLTAVHAAAERAATLFGRAGRPAGAPTTDGPTTEGAATPAGTGGPQVEETPDGVVRASVVLPNRLGLHARPAALLARAVAERGVPLTVDGVDGASVLELMALGAAGGHELTVEARGEGARTAVDAVVAMVATGFGET